MAHLLHSPRSLGPTGETRPPILSRRAALVGALQALALLAACTARLPGLPLPPEPSPAGGQGGSPTPGLSPTPPGQGGACVAPAVVAPTPLPYPGYTQVEPSTGLHVTGPAQEVDLASYRLKVTGLVDHPHSLSYDDVRCLPMVQAHVRLDCPGFFADEANLAGCTLASVLALAGPQPNATRVHLTSVENYSMSFALDEAQTAENFLAYGWEDQLLPASHGFPLRAVMPARAGSSWVKWVERIELS
jgi:DMSO/TMAO reductase YedYZ molybdopterin-dependent catalytic subunit